MPISVGIVDDHELVREGLRLILDSEPDIYVVGEAADAAAANELAQRAPPDVMLIDLTLENGDGISLLRDLGARYARIRLIALTMHQDEETVRQAFLAGAAGYVVKGAQSADLIAAIRAVALRQNYVHPVVASVVVADSLRWLRHEDRPSPRELEILRLVAEGRTASDASKLLGISVHTVRRHLANLGAKLGVHGRVALTRYAIEHHLIRNEG